MKRNYHCGTHYLTNYQDLVRQIAFHEAGHAAAIYLYNKQQQLPPVFFKVTIKKLDPVTNMPLDTCSLTQNRFFAAVEGGHLIDSLAVTESENYFSATELEAYQCALDADMINLLVGPLAEAKYVAIRDNECFNAQLVNINALHFYGGTSDLGRVYEYLEFFVADRNQHKDKMTEIFNKAFKFISSPVYWQAIERLADYITYSGENTISCEEAIVVLDENLN